MRLIGYKDLRRGGFVSGVLLTAAFLCVCLMAGCSKTDTAQDAVGASTAPVSASPANSATAPRSLPRPDEPLSFSQIVSSYKRVPRVNAEDCLVFRYTVRDPVGDDTLKVELPASDASGALTRSAWECRFFCYGTTVSRTPSKFEPVTVAGKPGSRAASASAPSQPKIILYSTPT
ncbi:MAG: hypothetical protein Q7T82_12580 [Armatimonadota bacterium]|nr:hypothetical protein [Armatimonadota bacterium]